MKELIRSLVMAAVMFIAPLAYAQVGPVEEPKTIAPPTVQETLQKASMPLYVGKQICKWNSEESFFGTSWTWGCEFKSQAICTVTLIKHEGYDYLALTAGHCIVPQMREDNYYVSDTVQDKPVLHKAEILKAENDDRYDFAIVRFQSMNEYPVMELNDPKDGAPAVGTELINVNYSLGLAQQTVHGVVTSGLLDVDQLKNRYLTTLQTGPGSSGSAVVNVKTGKIVGVLELGFPRSAMGAGVIPTGKTLFSFLEDDTAGMKTPPAVGEPPVNQGPAPLTVREHLLAIWTALTEWLNSLISLG